jgi:hypothetical protein
VFDRWVGTWALLLCIEKVTKQLLHEESRRTNPSVTRKVAARTMASAVRIILLSTLRARECRNPSITTSALATGMRVPQTVGYLALITQVHTVDTCSATIHVYFPFPSSCYLPFDTLTPPHGYPVLYVR